MTAPSPPVSGLNHKQVKSENENELPLENTWSEEHECVPLKQRLKMLRAKAVSESREQIFVSAVSPIDDDVKKEDDLCDSLDIHSDTDGQDDSITHSPKFQRSSSGDDNETSEDFFEDLDHVVLKDRRRMLLKRRLVGSIVPAMEHKNISDPSPNLLHQNTQDSGIRSEERSDIRSAIRGSDDFEKSIDNEAAGGSDTNKDHLLSSSSNSALTLALPVVLNVKAEPLDEELQAPKRDDQISVKSENVESGDFFQDIIDHMSLGDRMRLLASRKFPNAIPFEDFESPKTFVSSVNDECKASSSMPIVTKRPRKRRKTVTDSIETALEEDAPGLLQVLIEKGVLVDEIKLYGDNESDEPLNESLIEESFSELEDVISRIFSSKQSLLKFAPIRCAKGEKATYCLSCLISLVEQARYLRVRKWPVEWGWCRDLQSFIFVFERHNRIVLERPEYGYATYFFELVDALPVNWQVKRLVTAMKLTSCSRITLIENRPLLVGDDLTEGEARVLTEYGWIPNSGLGTMLNYCDRVVHDRKHDENDGSEWRSKIGKLLTDGYNGGIIVPNDIPKKLTQYEYGGGGGHTPEIKLEEY